MTMTSNDWKDAISAINIMDCEYDFFIGLIDLSVDLYEGNPVAFVKSIKDELSNIPMNTYKWEYANSRLSMLFKTYLS